MTQGSLIFFFSILLGILPSENTYFQSELSISPKIHFIQNTDHVILEPWAINSTNNEQNLLTYSFTVQKKGTSGTSTSKQSGQFSVAPNDSLKLSTVKLHASKGDTYYTELKILKSNELLIQKRKEFTLAVKKTDN